MKILQLAKILNFGNFNLKACLGCLNGFMSLVASNKQIYMSSISKKCYCKAVFRHGKPYIPMSIPTIKYYCT